MQIRSNPARWQRLKEILADALEQTSIEGRTAVFRESCADDTALFHEAERLLAKDTVFSKNSPGWPLYGSGNRSAIELEIE